jgi:peroxiredoxin Q/BCP
MNELTEGDPAPDFTLARSGGGSVSLHDFRGQDVVLYFYPKDDTTGCTKEACGFRDHYDALTAANAIVLGISPDSVASHERFADKYSLPFTLLADPDHAVAEEYGVWKEKSMYGKRYMGIERTTFLIDGQGVIRQIWRKVKPEAHAPEVLAMVASNR